jgi:tRNA modification GTPase
MFARDDTIVAIATPHGRGGIGVIRISGPASRRIAGALLDRPHPLKPRYATFARLEADGTADQVIATYFPAPHSFTGEDVVEISAHGSPVLLRDVVAAAVRSGGRLAEPGEFTFRAFLNGRMDLVQAEAVADLVDAVTPLQARAAFDQLEGTLTSTIREVHDELFHLCARLEASLDFPEEGYHFVQPGEAANEIETIAQRLRCLLDAASQGRIVREGMELVIAGRPNVGKSSVYNMLAGARRAIVTNVPGTTRDLLTETVEIEGIPVTLVDTAGINTSAVDPIELEGMTRASEARDVAAAVMLVLDLSAPLTHDDRQLLVETAGRARIVAANKIDLPAAWNPEDLGTTELVRISARTEEGATELRRAIAGVLTNHEPVRDIPAITNVRHASLVGSAHEALRRAAAAAAASTPEEFVLEDLNEARAKLEEITGVRTSEDVLAAIFERFCIGK